MAIAFGTFTANDETSSTDLVIVKPASTVLGDLLVVSVIDDANADLTHAGFTRIEQTTISSSRLTVAYKVATGSEPANYTFSSSSSYKSGILARYTKTGGTWNIEDSSQNTGSGDITSTSVTATDNSMLLICFGSDDNSGLDDTPVNMTQIDYRQPGSATVGAWYEARSAGAVTKTVENTGGDNSIIAVVIEAPVSPTTLPPTTLPPTTLAPTTLPPTTLAPTTLEPTTLPPTTLEPTTLPPTTIAPTTLPPTTLAPTTLPPTTLAPTTLAPTTLAPTTLEPTTLPPTSLAPTTLAPTTLPPTSLVPTTFVKPTLAPTTLPPTTLVPTTIGPTTFPPTTLAPTSLAPTTTLTTPAPPEVERRGYSRCGLSLRSGWR